MDDQLPTDMPRPGVVTWYRVYGVLLAVALIGYCIAALALMPMMLKAPGMTPQQRTQLMFSIPLGAVTYGLVGVIYAIVPFITPRNTVSYLIHAVMIGATMIPCCTIPAAATLLYFWVQPQTRYYFNAKF